MKKLHVPSPGEKYEDPLALYDVLSLSIALCLFLAIGGAILIMTSSKDEDPNPPIRLQSVPGTVDFSEVEQALRSLENLGPEKLRQFAWTPNTAIAAWEYGAREAAEAACEHFAPALFDTDASQNTENTENTEKLDARTAQNLTESLLRSLHRQSITAPWTCLSRLHLNAQLPPNTELARELENTWQVIEAFEGYGPLAASVVDGFRLSRNRPESPRFYRWLKLCAFQFAEQAPTSFAAAMPCHKLLHQISPEQGEDFIMAADRLWNDSLTERERHSIIRALNILARRGQPYAWRTDETPTMPDYNADFQLGVVFTLCRIVHSPDESDARQAAAAIAAVAGSSIRPADKNLLYRWRKTCRLAFLPRDADPDQELPLLQISTLTRQLPAEAPTDDQLLGEQIEADQHAEKSPTTQLLPDYTLASVIDRGDCQRFENRPDWYCGADHWRGGNKMPADALGDWYNETRYVEWID